MQLGVDYASIDGNSLPNFATAFSNGVRFAYIRRAYCYFDTAHRAHRCAFDTTYARDAEAARVAGLVVGAYLAPSFRAGAPSPAEQVANFEAAPGEVLPGDLPVALDVEFVGRGVQDTGLDARQCFQLVLEYVRELKKTHQTVAIYTSHVQWHDDNGLLGPDDPILDDVVLWQKTPYPHKAGTSYQGKASDYHEPHVGTVAWDPHDYWRVPRPWERNRPWLQQAEGDLVNVPGFDHTVDLNVFYPLSQGTVRPTDATRLAWLSRQLTRHGYQVPEPCNGLFSVHTRTALLTFQSKHGLSTDGVVGIRTYAALCGTAT